MIEKITNFDGEVYKLAFGEIVFKQEKRPCMVKIKGEDKKAFFHRWANKAEVVGESPLRGGNPGGQLWLVVGIVELENGQIQETYPQQIRFLDSDFQEYCWEDKTSSGLLED